MLCKSQVVIAYVRGTLASSSALPVRLLAMTVGWSAAVRRRIRPYGQLPPRSNIAGAVVAAAASAAVAGTVWWRVQRWDYTYTAENVSATGLCGCIDEVDTTDDL